MCTISRTARSNDAEFACDGLVMPLILRTYWSAEQDLKSSTSPASVEQRAADLRLNLLLFVMLERLRPDRAAHVVDQHVDAAEARQALPNTCCAPA